MRARERERERESDISIFKKMKVLYPGCLIKVTVRMGVNLFYCGCLVALDFHTDGEGSSLWNHNRGGG